MAERALPTGTERRFKARWVRRYREGEIVAVMFRRRVRLYAGRSLASRPWVHCWNSYGSRGVVVRAHRDCREQRVFGLQWRPVRMRESGDR